MTDIALLWDAETQRADLAMAGRYLAQTDELASAVTISLFTWARAKPDDPLPPQSPRMGWWGDSFATVSGDRIGSRLWLFEREKITPTTLTRIQEAAQE